MAVRWQVVNNLLLVLPPITALVGVNNCRQVVKKTAITVDDSVLPPTWTTVGAPPFDPTVKAKDAILDVPCARGTCYVQKDTVLVPSKSIYTLRIMTPSRPGLFQWHW